MRIEVRKLPLAGAFVIKPSRFEDGRGTFWKLFNLRALASQGVRPLFCEECLVTSKKGVLRGLHYQKGREAQSKLVSCVKGEIYDVIVDMRPRSRTYLKWAGVRLSEKNALVLYAPRGFAHGYLSLAQGSVVIYKADKCYAQKAETGVRWDDPALKIRWPARKPVLSGKDRAWPDIRG